jgi:hypothetical protein
MRKIALVLATFGAIGLSAVAAPAPAEAHWRGGSGAYAYGPDYGYVPYDLTYYGGRVGPCLRRCALYTTAYYSIEYAPVYTYRYRRVVPPAYAYYHHHHRWHHHW